MSSIEARQVFTTPETITFHDVLPLPGVRLAVLAEPCEGGSIHRARLVRGTSIPPHTHPADEHVLVLSGTLETGGRRCTEGTFWSTPAGTRQGPHVALTDVELLTLRLGPMGVFEDR